ncbi:casein kinase II regulatory subunit-domain-containing protein [Mrakia frigida]|uniref:casein kinase II subunit beta n=1 Tax=Mrakia frigida TaxID=29902 RepID=UPI003FCBFBC0
MSDLASASHEQEMDPEAQQDTEDLEGYASSSPPSSTQTSTLTWITWFTSLPGHEYFCEVAEEFIEDDFNLTGLQTMVPFWKEALEMVLDVEPEDESNRIPDASIVETSAELLYGLVHQRYILTRQGLQAMVNKTFGACPRVYCHATAVIPCGRSDQPGLDTVKLYCPNCGDIYSPPSSRFQGVDGAFFGTTFPHLFYQTYRELFPAPFYSAPSSLPPPPTTLCAPTASSSQQPPNSSSSTTSSSSSPGGPPAPSTTTTTTTPTNVPAFRNPDPHGGQKQAYGEVYSKKIYGFKVSERARSGPRMMWLRERPKALEELDRVDWRGRWVGEEGDGEGGEDAREGREGGEKGDLFEGVAGGQDEEVEGEESEEEEEEEEEEKASAPPAATTTTAPTSATVTSSAPTPSPRR